MIVVRTKAGSSECFLTEVEIITSITRTLENLKIFPPIDKILLGDNKLYIYLEE